MPGNLPGDFWVPLMAAASADRALYDRGHCRAQRQVEHAMPISSNSLPQVSPRRHEPALPAFTALYDEALRRCSTQYDLPVTLGEEMRLRAWRLCWLALDAASAPANNLPDIADAQAWPPELVAQLRAAPALPKLKAQAWQELRRARDQQLFAALPTQGPDTAESTADQALATMLNEGFARLGLEQLRAWITPSVTAALTRWLSACLLAVDALSLSDNDTDAAALELVVFVQSSLERVHGAVATADDTAQNEPKPSAAVSDERVLEAARAAEPTAAPQPRPAASPAASPAAPRPGASDVAAAPNVPQPAGAIEQPPTSTGEDTRLDAAQTAKQPRRQKPRAVALVASVVAAAAVLLLMLNSGDVTPAPEAIQPTQEMTPPSATPEPSAAPVVAPKPPVVDSVDPVPSAPVAAPVTTPQPTSIKPPTSTAPQRPRFRNLAAAKRAHAAKKIDDDAYAAAVAELEALRKARIAKEQLELRRGKLTQREYQRRVNAINRHLGFGRR